MDRPVEERFDRIVQVAQHLFDVPLVSLTLIDEDRQWRLAWWGRLDRQTDLTGSLCREVVVRDEPLVIADLAADPLYRDNPYVVGPPFLRFYAGTPLHAPGGEPVGTLCLMDVQPRRLSYHQTRDLTDLGSWAQQELVGQRY